MRDRAETARLGELFGAKIKTFREAKGLSQKQLELELTGRGTGSYVNSIERGEHCPTLLSLVRFAKTLHVPLAALVEGIE